MPDDSPPISSISPSGCIKPGCGLFVGFFLAGLVGMALAFAAFQGNGPGWLAPVVFFLPPILFLLGWCAVVIPNAVRQVRAAQRSAPSPESVAAIAAGEGVEAGVKPDPSQLLPRRKSHRGRGADLPGHGPPSSSPKERACPRLSVRVRGRYRLVLERDCERVRVSACGQVEPWWGVPVV